MIAQIRNCDCNLGELSDQVNCKLHVITIAWDLEMLLFVQLQIEDVHAVHTKSCPKVNSLLKKSH